MPRGQRNYYDPILQVPGQVEGAPDLSRIELFPIGQESTSRLPEEIGKWVARRIEADGSISGYTPGDFNHDAALVQAQERWPGLIVYELNAEIEDSTWEGTGPSPRLWQNAIGETAAPVAAPVAADLTPAGEPDQLIIRPLVVESPGTYIRLEDVLTILEEYAAQFDEDHNPSAALGLREAAKALREPF